MKIRKILTLGTVVMALTGNVVGFAQVEPVLNQNSDASISFKAGTLNLDSVSNFDFDKHEWSIERLLKQDYQLTQDFKLRVTDNRGPGVGDGWQLTAQLQSFKDVNSADSLKGAYISFGEVTSSLVLPENVVDASAYNVVKGPTLPNPNEDSKVIVKTDNVAIPVAAAFRGTNDYTGLGTWEVLWKQDKINLTLLEGTATDGSHKATMTWILGNSPLVGDLSTP